MASDLKALPHPYAGDSFRWFVGTVVNHLPPPGFEGRVQVRIRGIHSANTSDVGQKDLPWAQVMLPGTEEGSSGLGRISRITTGATVWGFFLDGKSSQVPVVVASFVKTENETPLQSRKQRAVPEFNYKVGTNIKYSYVDSVEELYAEFKNINREVTEIVFDWTETYMNKDLDAQDIDAMSGGIGYHYVVRRDGTVQRGVNVNADGVVSDRVTSHNKRSVVIVLVGGLLAPSGIPNAQYYKDARALTDSQIKSVHSIMSAWFRAFPGGQAIGAKDVDADTDGPGFDVIQYAQDEFGKFTLFDTSKGFITRASFTKAELNQTALATGRAYTPSVNKNDKIAGVLDFIAEFESAGDYTAVYPNSKQPSILVMTLNELIADMAVRLAKYGSDASGRYQFINKPNAPTLTEIANRLNYDFDKVVYSKATQDAMAVQILNDRADFQKWLNGTITTYQFLKNISRIWASLPDPDSGGSYYKNVGTNKALVTAQDAINTLDAL